MQIPQFNNIDSLLLHMVTETQECYPPVCGTALLQGEKIELTGICWYNVKCLSIMSPIYHETTWLVLKTRKEIYLGVYHGGDIDELFTAVLHDTNLYDELIATCKGEW